MPEVPLPITLSPPDLHALELAQTALLSPLDYRNTESWRAVASARIAQLIGAHRAAFTPPRISGAPSRCAAVSELGGAPGASAGLDTTGATARRTRRPLAIDHRIHLYHATRGASEVFVDWVRPGDPGDYEGLSVAADPDALLSSLRLTRKNSHLELSGVDSFDTFGERELGFLRLLLPAFRAGVRTHVGFIVHREALVTIFDRIADGAAVWDRAGICRYRNRALDDLLAADSERSILERWLTDFVTLIVTNRRTTTGDAYDHTLVTAANRYRVQATYAASLGAREPWVVTLVRPARRFQSAELLQARYGLTPRQSEVAQMLAEGRSDISIARALRISRRTAEHHAEAVRLSLGVHSRAALAAVLQQNI